MRRVDAVKRVFEAAASVNAAIRRAGLEGKRRTNPVVDGQLVPKSGPRRGRIPKRRREEPTAATPSTRARRPRRAVNFDDFELDDDDEDEGHQLEPDDDDGWD